MRVRHWILLGSTSLLVSGAIAVGCGGGSSTDNTPGPDGGDENALTDQHAEAAADTGAADHQVPGEAGGDASCAVDADLSKVPDAGLADGATSVGLCLGCMNTSCKQQFQDCNADCACHTAAARFAQCVASNNPPNDCLPSNPPSTMLGLEVCVLGYCGAACGISFPSFDAGSDAATDASDGGDGGDGGQVVDSGGEGG